MGTTMKLNSLIPGFCLLLVSVCQGLRLEGLKEQKAREGKKQVGLPCKTIVTEECTEKEVPRSEEVCEALREQPKREECSRRCSSPPPSPPRTRAPPPRLPQGSVATTPPPPPADTTTTAPSTGSATQATIGTATGHVPAEVPLRKTALKCLQGTAT